MNEKLDLRNDWFRAVVDANSFTPLAFDVIGIRVENAIIQPLSRREVTWRQVANSEFSIKQLKELETFVQRIHGSFGISFPLPEPSLRITWGGNVAGFCDFALRRLRKWAKEDSVNVGVYGIPDWREQEEILYEFFNQETSRKKISYSASLYERAEQAINSGTSKKAAALYRRAVVNREPSPKRLLLLEDLAFEVRTATLDEAERIKAQDGIVVPDYILDYFNIDFN